MKGIKTDYFFESIIDWVKIIKTDLIEWIIDWQNRVKGIMTDYFFEWNNEWTKKIETGLLFEWIINSVDTWACM